MTSKFSIDFAMLKDVVGKLNAPERLDDHPLACTKFVQASIEQHLERKDYGRGRALGWALSDVWRELSLPARIAPEFKREWISFATLEVGFLYPFRKGIRLPNSLEQIGALLLDRDYLALVIADGHAEQAKTLLEPEYAQFWDVVAPLFKSNEDAVCASTIQSRRDTALKRLAQELEKRESVSILPSSPPPASAKFTQPAMVEDIDIPPSSTIPGLDLYLNDLLAPVPLYLPDEWHAMLELARAAQRLVIRGTAGSGKTALMRTISVHLQVDLVPIYVDLSEYARCVRMDIFYFVVTHGALSEIAQSKDAREELVHELAEAEQAGRVLILADQADNLLESEINEVSRRLSGFRHLILAERSAHLPLDRTGAVLVQMPRLSGQSLKKILQAIDAPPSLSSEFIVDLQRAGVDMTPGLLVVGVTAARNKMNLGPVVILDQWVEQLIAKACSTGKILNKQSKLRQLLRLLAGIHLNLLPSPALTSQLVRDNIRRCFREMALKPATEDQGWDLMELGVRSGLLTQDGDAWSFTDTSIERFLAAELLFEDGARILLHSRYQSVMQWTAALIARRSSEQQQKEFFNRLRIAMDDLTEISALDIAEWLVEFKQHESSAFQDFKRTVSECLNMLAQVDSAHVRHALQAKAERLGISIDLWQVDYQQSPLIELDPYAQDLAGLLHSLGITRSRGDEARWLEDRRVLIGLIEGLTNGPTSELRLRCAAWLRRSSLSKRIEIDLHVIQLRKSPLRSALEMLAELAADRTPDATTRVLARSILAQDDLILRLWQLDEYKAVVYDLLLTLGKRLYRVRSTPKSDEWRMLD